jgi:hypothetical protein
MKLAIRIAVRRATKTYEDLELAYTALKNAHNELILAVQVMPSSPNLTELVEKVANEISDFEKEHFVKTRS